METNPFIHIRSPQFRILPGEDAELVNEGTHGKALAEYLRPRLTKRGYRATGIVCEDWGWWLTVDGLPFPCGICIYGARIGASDDLDLCVTISTPAARKWSWRKFGFIGTSAEIDRLHEALRRLFAEDPHIVVVGETAEFPLG